MSKIRRVFKRYERIFVLGLIVFLLVIFTVTDVITGMARGGQGGLSRDEVVGSFEILPQERHEVTVDEFERASRRLGVVMLQRGSRVSNGDVWRRLVNLEAARREGIRVSDARLVEELRQLGFMFGVDIFAKDKGPYRRFVQSQFGVTTAEFEEAIRDAITERTLLDLYRESFEVAPPQSRKELAEQFANQVRENARVTWAALDAAPFLEAARSELGAESDADAVLKEFYETDAAVKTTPIDFRRERSYSFEMLYAIHERIDEEGYRRIADLFSRTFPHANMADLDRFLDDEAIREYFGQYADRLIEDEGTSWEELESKVVAPDEEPAEGEGEEPAESEDEAPPEGADAEAERREKERVRDEARSLGFGVVKDRIVREMRLRGMFGFLNAEARKQPDKSLAELVDRLAAHDSAEDPVISREPGKGLLVYREFREPITGSEIDELEDAGVEFTLNVRLRINDVDADNLPQVSKDSHPVGALADGRMIFRVTRVELERKKQYGELSESEKETLLEKYYLPAKARDRAREALEDLRKVAVEEKLEHDAFVARARELGARVVDDQWIECGYDRFVEEPDPAEYWPAAYQVMRDRYFLRRTLAGPLIQARREKKLELPAYFEVSVDSRRDAKAPGAAYLPLVLERDPPSGSNMPAADAAQFAQREREARGAEVARRWTDLRGLVSRYRMEFYGEMKERMERELKAAAE